MDKLPVVHINTQPNTVLLEYIGCDFCNDGIMSDLDFNWLGSLEGLAIKTECGGAPSTTVDMYIDPDYNNKVAYIAEYTRSDGALYGFGIVTSDLKLWNKCYGTQANYNSKTNPIPCILLHPTLKAGVDLTTGKHTGAGATVTTRIVSYGSGYNKRLFVGNIGFGDYPNSSGVEQISLLVSSILTQQPTATAVPINPDLKYI